MRSRIWRGLIPIFAMLLVIAITCTSLLWQYAGNVDRILGITHTNVEGEGEIVFKSDYAETDGSLTEQGRADLVADIKAHSIQTMEEGAVLLKNDRALPLENDETNITLLGRAVADPLYRLATGGPSFGNDGITMKAAMETAGFVVNETVFNAYANSSTRRNTQTGEIGEEDESFYTQELIDSFASYNDAAIVMLSRTCGDGQDGCTVAVDGNSALALHEDERDLLTLANQYFSKVIVLLNMGNPMELGWINDPVYGADAVLWIGTPGSYGFEGVANILTGAANPSGGLIDTYAVNSFSSAAMQNYGDFTYANAAEYDLSNIGQSLDVIDKYVVMKEGIYVGYYYYETRYEDSVLGRYNADSKAGVFDSTGGWNYAEEVAFPFGFGLSYTTFSYEITDFTSDGAAGEEFAVTVRVTNTGEVAGKTPVQIYVQTPYTDYDREHLVEKSAVTLVGFDKTGDIAPGEYEDVTVSVDKYLLASYDITAHDGEGGYILDNGNYYFGIGNGAHEALNNILALKAAEEGLTVELYDHDGVATEGNASAASLWQLDEFDDSTYTNSAETGARVDNKMEDADLNYWIDGAVTYLTRQDWNTFPTPAGGIEVTQEMAEKLMKDSRGDKTFEAYEKAADTPGKDAYTQGAPVTIKLYDMKDAAYDDERWEVFLDQFTVAQLAAMTTDMNGVKSVAAVGFPGNSQGPGPDGTFVQYAGESVAAATFNPEILTLRGNYLAEEGLFQNKSCQWGIGANVHRVPFGGRNFEYYSECANMSYLCGALQARAMSDKGLFGSKHFAGNTQEMHRKGVCEFGSEQAWRQIDLRGFEGTFTKGGSLNTMTSYSRYGLTLTCEYGAVNNGILRGEWGFKGFTITDAGSGSPIDGLIGGTDMYCMEDFSRILITQINTNDDGYVLGLLRNAAKNTLYALCRTNMVNLLSEDMVIRDTLSWWQYAVIAIDAVIGAACAGSIVMYVLSEYILKKRRTA